MKRIALYWVLGCFFSLLIGYGVLMAALTWAGPSVIREQLTRWTASIGRPLTIGNIHFSPGSWTLDMDAVRLFDRDHRVLFSAKRISIDLAPYAWLMGQWCINAFTLDSPHITLIRNAQGEWNWLHLIREVDARFPSLANSSLDIIVKDMLIKQGMITIREGIEGAPRHWFMHPLSLNLVNLSTFPREEGRGGYALTATTSDGVRLSWYGNFINLRPFDSFGEARIEGMPLSLLRSYLPAFKKGMKLDGRLTMNATYHFASHPHAPPKLTLSPLYIELADIHAVSNGQTLLKLKSLHFDDGIFDWQKQAVFFKRARLGKAEIVAERRALEELGWSKMANVWVNRDKEKKKTVSKTSLAGWHVYINAISLEDWQVHFIAQNRASPCVVKANIPRANAKLRITQNDGVSLSNINVSLTNIELGQKKARDPSIKIAALSMVNGTLQPQHIELGTISVSGLDITVVRLRDRVLNIFAAVREQIVSLTDEKLFSRVSLSQRVRLTEIAIRDSTIHWIDKVRDRPLSVRLDKITGQVMYAAETGLFAYSIHACMQSGRVRVEGTVRPDTGIIRVSLKTMALPLIPLAPYFLDQHVLTLTSGTLSTNMSIAYNNIGNTNTLDIAGNAMLSKLAFVVAGNTQPFLTLDTLKLVGISSLKRNNYSIGVRDVYVERPYVQLAVGSDRTRPVANRVPIWQEALWGQFGGIEMKKITLLKGTMDFIDHGVSPLFATRFYHLRGTAFGVSTQGNGRGSLILEGRVDRYGEVSVRGKRVSVMGVDSTDLTMTLRGFPIVKLNPYLAHALGGQMASGQLAVDLRYQSVGRDWQGTHHIVVDSIALGKKGSGNNPETLPLAMALFVDRNNQIELNMSIRGALDDPSLNYRRAFWHPIAEKIKKTQHDPFLALAEQFGKASVAKVNFLPGESYLTPSTRDALGNIGEMLCQRPHLVVYVAANYDSANELRTLARRRVNVAILKEAGLNAVSDAVPLELDWQSKIIQSAVKQVFMQRIGRVTLLARWLASSGIGSAAWVRQRWDELVQAELAQLDEAAALALADASVDGAIGQLTQGCPELSARIVKAPAIKGQASDLSKGSTLILKLGVR